MKKRLVMLAIAAGATLSMGACLDPTEIRVVIRTDPRTCRDPARWHGVAIYIGKPGDDVESRAPALVTSACDAQGTIGSVVLAPTGARDADVGIRAVAGIARGPELCVNGDYEGCIVARRTLSYVAHESQELVIDLASDCVSVGCDALHTCLAGACTSTRFVAADVAPDAEAATEARTVRCGDEGVRCPVGDPTRVCCVKLSDAGVSTGACIAPAACPATSTVLRCDKTSDCGEGDPNDPPYCCASIAFVPGAGLSGSSCVPFSTCIGSTAGRSLCQDRAPCKTTKPGAGPLNLCGPDPTLAPGYFLCVMN